MSLTAKHSDLEAVRATLSLIASRYGGLSSPTSTTAMTFALRGRLHVPSVTEILQMLGQIRDAQSLGRGFWVPTPTHAISTGHFSLIVSGLPNQELHRQYGLDPYFLGASRLAPIDVECSKLMPTSAFADWLEAPVSTVKWGKREISQARYVPPLGVEGDHYFRHWRASGSSRWVSISAGSLPSSGVVLARHQAITKQTNHYLLRLHQSQIVAMSELPHDSDYVLRLQFALRTIGEDSPLVHVRLTGKKNLVEINLPPVPAAELRLLVAIGEMSAEPVYGRLTAIIHESTLEDVISVLTSLGCEQNRERA